MGFFKSVGKAFSHAAKSVGKMAKNVFSSKIVNVATKALNFIPGLNGAGLIGKAVSLLASGGSIQQWLKSGLNLFGGIAGKFGLSGKVANLVSGQSQPLGAVMQLAGGKPPRLTALLSALSPGFPAFQNGANLAKILASGNSSLLHNLLIPADFDSAFKALEQMPPWADEHFLDQIGRPEAQVMAISSMMQQLISLTTPAPIGKGAGQIIRA